MVQQAFPRIGILLAAVFLCGFKAPELEGSKAVYHFNDKKVEAIGDEPETFRVLVGFSPSVNRGCSSRRQSAEKFIDKLSHVLGSETNVAIFLERLYVDTREALLRIELPSGSKTTSVRARILRKLKASPEIRFSGAPIRVRAEQ